MLPDRIGAPPGSYLVCAYVVMLAGTGSDATTATASTVLSIRAARDHITIQARNLRNGHGALTVHYHVEPGTYSRDRPLWIFQDTCDGTHARAIRTGSPTTYTHSTSVHQTPTAMASRH